MSLLLTPPHKSPSAPLARWGIFRDETGENHLTKYTGRRRPARRGAPRGRRRRAWGETATDLREWARMAEPPGDRTTLALAAYGLVPWMLAAWAPDPDERRTAPRGDAPGGAILPSVAARRSTPWGNDPGPVVESRWPFWGNDPGSIGGMQNGLDNGWTWNWRRTCSPSGRRARQARARPHPEAPRRRPPPARTPVGGGPRLGVSRSRLGIPWC